MNADKISRIINDYDGENIPEELREVCMDYFNQDHSGDSSSGDDTDDEILAQPLHNVATNSDVVELNIEDIPVILDEQVIDLEILGNILPVEEVNELNEPTQEGPIPTIGQVDENDELVPVWEAVEYDERTVADDTLIRNLIEEGCCSKKCTDKFQLEEITTFNLESKGFDYYIDGSNILDTIILGELRALCWTHDSIKAGSWTLKQERKRFRMLYTLRGESVCEKLFLIAHGIKIKRFKRLLKIFKRDGMVLSVYGNIRRTPKNVCSYDRTVKVVQFIRNYAEESALFMPGRLANQYNIVKLLPSSDKKIALYRRYKQVCDAASEKPVGKSLFKEIWLTFCPDVVIMRPKSDLCALCQKNYTSHANLRGFSEQEKLDFFQKCQDHLNLVQVERKAYKETIKSTVASFNNDSLQINEDGRYIPNSYYGEVHYSFDFAQQIHIPFDSLQLGPVYFLTPYKVGLFGIMNDTLKIQHNFLIPEACQISKGANAIVSYLDFYLENHGLGESIMYLHADNCVAQNKNNIVMSYLNWRVLNGLNEQITLSFLPVGHTKFACDWAFGLFKQRVRVEKGSCLADVAKIVEDSTPKSKVNRSIFAGTENGEVIVPIRDWQTFFANKKWNVIPGITKYNHFTFESSDKGKVSLQKVTDGQMTVSVISDPDPVNDLPSTITPAGLSHKRKLYFFEKIRPYCPDKDKETLCPMPDPLEDIEDTPNEMPSTSSAKIGKRKKTTNKSQQNPKAKRVKKK